MAFPYDLLKPDHFQGLGRISGDSAETLVALLNTLGASAARAETDADLTLYLDPVNGSDSWDGLTQSYPLRTCAKLATLIPNRIRHQVTVNFAAGSFDPLVLVGKYVEPKAGLGTRLSFKGATSLKSLSSGVNTFLPSASTSNTVVKPIAAPVWVAGELDNQLLYCVSGPRAGQTFLIRTNDATTIYLQRSSLGSAIQLTNTFEVKERKTIFDCSVPGGLMNIGGLQMWGVDSVDKVWNAPDIAFDGFIFDKRPSLFIGGASFNGCQSDIALLNCLFTNGAMPLFDCCSYARLQASSVLLPAGFSIMGLERCRSIVVFESVLKGSGIISSPYEVQNLNLSNSWFEDIPSIDIMEGTIVSLGGSTFKNTPLTAAMCLRFDTYRNLFTNSPSDGLVLQGISQATFDTDTIQNNGGEGILLEQTFAQLLGVVGAGNALHGARLANGSMLKSLGGNTLTGISGDVKPGALAAVAWAALPVTDPTQLVRAYV